MTTWKICFRNFLGLILIISSVLAGLDIILDILAAFAYFSHEEAVASKFFHESLYLLVFFIPPFFIGRYINKAEFIKGVEEYTLTKCRSEQW